MKIKGEAMPDRRAIVLVLNLRESAKSADAFARAG
jgi:hypothetical protein